MYPKSIFDIPRKKEDLVSSNQGMSNLYYDEIAPLRNIIDSGATSNNFGNGLISYRWHPASGSWWIPSRSYFRIDIELTKPNGTDPLEQEDDIAIQMGAGSCLFSKMQYKINDKTISEISEHVPQVDAMKTRLNRTGQWMETTGDNLNFWDHSQEKRKQKIIANGINYDELIFNQDINAAGAGNGVVPRWLDSFGAGPGPNTIEFVAGAAGAGEIRLLAAGGQPIPDLSKYLSIGDTIYYNDGGEVVAQIDSFLTTVTANDTIVPDEAILVVGAAALVRQLRIPERAIDVQLSRDRNVKNMSIIYQPPLSIFSINHGIPGSSKHEIDLVPYSNNVYQRNMIESILLNKTHTTDGIVGDFRFKVTEMLFYAARCDGPIMEKDEFFLDLEETRLQISQITTNTRSQFSLDISPATHAISIAFQDENVDGDSRRSQTKFKISNDEELNLTNFYVRYGGIQKPQPDFRPLYNEATNTDRLVEQYARSIFYNGSYYDSSTETLDEWKNRGIFLHWPWPKTGTDRETRVYVSTEFSALTGTPRLLLFNHFKKVVILKYENGSLTEVLVNEV